MKIGIQQLQIGSILKNEKDTLNNLKLLKEKGFDYMELNGFMIRKNPFIVKMLTSLSGMPIKSSDKFNWEKLINDSKLDVLSIHEDINALESNLDLVISECRIFNSKYVVLTGNYKFDYNNEKNLLDLCQRLNKIGKSLKEKGIRQYDVTLTNSQIS